MFFKKQDSNVSETSDDGLSGCPNCVKNCRTCHSRVKSLEKKLYAITIVLTIATTLLGQKGIETLTSTTASVNSLIDGGNKSATDDLKKDDGHAKQDNHQPIGKQAFFQPWQQKQPPSNTQDMRPYSIEDELARYSKKPSDKKDQKQKEEELVTALDPKHKDFTDTIVKVALEKSDDNMSLIANKNGLPDDPYAIFFTPSYMPFDVYSTTLALGNNYGLGPYYGIDTGSYNPPNPIPAPSSITAIALSQIFNTFRKRV